MDDLVNVMDLAPTFLEACGLEPHPTMTARSLMPVLESGESGRVDPTRDHIVTGRERHVRAARAGNLPYPQRAIRTHDYLYIVNFAPDRWPMGDPRGLDDPTTEPPPYEDLCNDTYVAYADLDASPTKAWMVHHRAEKPVEPLYQLGFGKRPEKELYDLESDPDHMTNLAGHPDYEAVEQELETRLFETLRKQEDPRLVEPNCRFERSPYTD